MAAIVKFLVIVAVGQPGAFDVTYARVQSRWAMMHGPMVVAGPSWLAGWVAEVHSGTTSRLLAREQATGW
jgi:hypothetical protein